MSLINLTVHKRTTVGKNENRRTRAAGRIPAVLYGEGNPAATVEVDTQEFGKIYANLHGRNAIFNLTVEGEAEERVALLREIQQHPVTDEIRHLDLFEIPRGQNVTVEVPLVLHGEPLVVRFGEGEVIQTLDRIQVACLPREMPDLITFDVSSLGLMDKRFVRDLVAPAGEIASDPDLQILVVKPSALALGAGEGEASAKPE